MKSVGDPLQRLVAPAVQDSANTKATTKTADGTVENSAAPLPRRTTNRTHEAQEVMSEGSDESADERNQRSTLENLIPLIEAARQFAERWDETYRSSIFRIALERLLGGVAGVSTQREHRIAVRHVIADKPHDGADEGGRAGGAYQRLARSLNIDVDSVERLVDIDETGRVHILARIDGLSNRERQAKYSAVYLYLKEVGLGERMVDIGELRTLCVEHGCYDMANFTGNFAKDVTAGVLRQQGDRGARSRKFLLSKKGLDAAAVLLQQLAGQ